MFKNWNYYDWMYSVCYSYWLWIWMMKVINLGEFHWFHLWIGKEFILYVNNNKIFINNISIKHFNNIIINQNSKL